jgi:polyvinyl alcohol dehydrogenase (cytochrome)
MSKEVATSIAPLAATLLLWLPLAAGADAPPNAASSIEKLTGAQASSPEGEALYASRCAACHDHASGRVPPKVLITVTRAAEDVIDTLTLGVMRPQASGLTPQQIRSLAIYLTGKLPVPRAPPDANPCPAPAAVQLASGDWRSWGRDLADSRFQPDPGFSAAQVPKLKLRWTFAYPGRAAFGQPAVAGDLLLAGGTGGRLFALDAKSGCTHWNYDAGALIRTGIVIDQVPAARTTGQRARLVAWFGDDKGILHAVDVRDGKSLWAVQLDEHPIVRLVGTPQLHAGILYAPVSSFEEVAAADPKYPCCTFRGSLVAVDAASGKLLWRAYTVREPAAPIAASGQTLSGPAGGSIFSAPTIDAEHGLIYAGTGDSYTNVVSDSTNAVIALKLTDGARVWTHQVLKNDAWILLCSGKPTGNCPSPLGPDFDFASSPMLIRSAAGAVLVAGAKSGIVYALAPHSGGRLLWQRALAAGTSNGAILWGPATDGTRAYIATSEYNPQERNGPGALVALDPATGAVLWRTVTPEVRCAWGTENCAHALLAGVAVIPGVVFAGAMDGYMRAYDARDGRIIWQFDTGQTFTAVNGVQGHGGAIDYGGEVIAHGMLYVNSGSMRQPGNLLLAFGPARE